MASESQRELRISRILALEVGKFVHKVSFLHGMPVRGFFVFKLFHPN